MSLERRDGICEMCLMFLHYISDENIKTTKDQVTTQSITTFQFQIFVLLNSTSVKVIAVELHRSVFIYKGLHLN